MTLRKPIHSKLIQKFFRNKGLRRKIIPKADAQEMTQEFKREIAKNSSGFFGQFPAIVKGKKVYVGNWKGHQIAFKVTQDASIEGAKPEIAIRDIDLHNQAVRNGTIDPKTYVLRRPHVYGHHNGVLLLEYIHKANNLPKSQVEKAVRELEDHFKSLRANPSFGHPLSGSRVPLQARDFIPAGKINGKIILYSVYDYV